MTSRARVAAAMRHEKPDRVPVMCQLALGHYFLHSGFDPADIWYDNIVFGDALLRMADRYSFDGVLVNLPGRPRRVARRTPVPNDDLPLFEPSMRDIREFEPNRLFYVEPYGANGQERLCSFPDHQYDITRYVRSAAPDVSVHAEVFSPLTQLLELLGYSSALMALIDEPGRVHDCLAALVRGTGELMRGHASVGADAILISSAFAGAGFISRAHYAEFVMPYERACIDAFKIEHPNVPVYTHTCGAIGDRLDLMMETGTDGIDTLDPPPLGTVDLADAVRQLADRVFIKGNIDPVHTMLEGTAEAVYNDAIERLQLTTDVYGYILSTACSVAPRTSPRNIRQLIRAVDDAGWYV